VTSPLYPTPTRKALLRAIAANDGKVYLEAGEVWDMNRGGKVTARMKEVVNAGWIRAAGPSERPENALSGRKYYVLTSDGARVLRGDGR
jgi:hypothetical protein